ncbi:MAG: cytochrome ubiquinol oxidase subunit I, partial [Candidatus Micrarchaeota archaeon]|nr:cytochrome ubiquinol oxidase subunit I [Candidatus Micrarchaeota archaeon]
MGIMLDSVFFDRFAMGFSLGVHILIVMFGVTMPVIILLADYLWIAKGDMVYKTLSNRLVTAFAILFAVGTASGTLVAIDLLVLWPKFMALVGQVAISTVNIEVIVFFAEAIFLTTYFLYRERFSSKYVRVVLMAIVAIAAASSGVMITYLNSFMNTPVGFNIT